MFVGRAKLNCIDGFSNSNVTKKKVTTGWMEGSPVRMTQQNQRTPSRLGLHPLTGRRFQHFDFGQVSLARQKICEKYSKSQIH